MFYVTSIENSSCRLSAIGLSKLCQTNIVAAYFPALSGIHDTAGQKVCPVTSFPVIHDKDCTASDES